MLTAFAAVSISLAAGGLFGQSSSVAGEWDASMNTRGGARPFKMVLKLDGDKLTGTVKLSDREFSLRGEIKGADIAFEYTEPFQYGDMRLRFAGKVTGESMSGIVTFGDLVVIPNTDTPAQDSWSATRTLAAKAKPATQSLSAFEEWDALMNTPVTARPFMMVPSGSEITRRIQR